MTGILGAYRGNFGRATVLDITRPITNHVHPDIHMLFAVSGAPSGMQPRRGDDEAADKRGRNFRHQVREWLPSEK